MISVGQLLETLTALLGFLAGLMLILGDPGWASYFGFAASCIYLIGRIIYHLGR